MKIIVTGTLAFDYIMNLTGHFRDYIMPDQIHILNVSFNADRMRKSQGGTAGNIAYTLALLGQKPTITTTVGKDFSEYKNFLEQHGIDCNSIKIIPDQLTSTGFCITDLDDNQIWSFSLNASNDIPKISLKSLLTPHSFVVISPSGPEGVKHFLHQCITAKCRYMFDPAFAIPALTPEELKEGIQMAEILIGNDYEINLIKQKTGLTEPQLLENSRILITTLGNRGSIIQKDDKTYEIPIAKPSKILDPAGAGDAYRAGFLAGYLNNLPLETSGRIGSLTAAYTVEKYGTTTHDFTIEEFKNRYHQNFDQPFSGMTT